MVYNFNKGFFWGLMERFVKAEIPGGVSSSMFSPQSCTFIGLDWSTDVGKRGISVGKYDSGSLNITRSGVGSNEDDIEKEVKTSLEQHVRVLLANVLKPDKENEAMARKEGWIWVKPKNNV